MTASKTEMGRLAVRVALGLDTAGAECQAEGEGTITRIACPIVRRGSVASPRQALMVR